MSRRVNLPHLRNAAPTPGRQIAGRYQGCRTDVADIITNFSLDRDCDHALAMASNACNCVSIASRLAKAIMFGPSQGALSGS